MREGCFFDKLIRNRPIIGVEAALIRRRTWLEERR
jgi:hypothetical protein